ncbi:MAG: FtsX-like permease family protein [Rhodospirillaceae bacterium]
MLQTVHIGFRMLSHDKRRLFLSLCGIAFAVVIMFLQVGFFNGINDSQANIARVVDADMVIMHHKRTHLNKWTRFDAVRIGQVRALPEVREVVPIYKDGAGLKNPETNQVRRTIVYAFDAGAKPFRLKGLTDDLYALLRVKGNVLYDRRSRDIYGDFKVGDTLEIDARAYRLAGFVDLGPNLVNDGTVLMGDGSWGAGGRPVMALLRFAVGSDAAQTAAAVRAALPGDLIAFTPAELAEREIWYTVINAPIGAIFAVGLLVSIIIGVVICYQILFNEVTDNIPQYATLKAMGYGPRYLVGVILEETALLAVAGFIPGLLVSLLLYEGIGDMTRLVMFLTPGRIAAIFFLTLVMCVAAGLLAIRKVLRLDPADLF